MAKYKEIIFDDIERLLDKNEKDKEFAKRIPIPLKSAT